MSKQNLDQYLVVGNPIDHSRSPDLHMEFAAQTEQTLSYTKALIALGEFATDLNQLRHDPNLKGMNVTLPFKADAYEYVKTVEGVLSDNAQRCQACNTLHFVDDQVYGYNTDGPGLLTDITQNLQFNVKGKNILILGAGGAVQGILPHLWDNDPSAITLAVRNQEKVRKIIGTLPAVKLCGFEDLNQPFDLIINGIPSGLTTDLPPLNPTLVQPHTLCYDLVTEPTTPFMEFAKSTEAKQVINGWGMLVEQAALSFEIWRGIKPDTSGLIAKR